MRPEALPELDRLAAALLELDRQIPPDIPWIIRVDGHTDRRPITTLAVPLELGALGSPRHRGGAVPDLEGRPGRSASPRPASASSSRSTSATTDEAYARNRRIELKLTER